MNASARPLTRDVEVSAYSALDTLHRIGKRWDWVSLWILCADNYANVTLNTPVQEAVTEIEKHGGAIGIVGLAIVRRSFQFLKKPLRKGADINKKLDASGNMAADRFLKLVDEFRAFQRTQVQ